MDTSTGQIHNLNIIEEFQKGIPVKRMETMQEMGRRLDIAEKNLVQLDKLPDPNCKRCHGTGSKRRGTKKRALYIPCGCTGDPQ